MFKLKTIPVDYDGRFGHDEYCKEASWYRDPNRHGEKWLFSFPNGKRVSVVRCAIWDYKSVVEEFYSYAASLGFSRGLYETAVLDGGHLEDPEGFLSCKEVIAELDRVMNMKKE